MEQWPPLSATKECLKTSLDKVNHNGKVVPNGPMKHASPNVSKNAIIGMNFATTTGELGEKGITVEVTQPQVNLPHTEAGKGQNQWANMFVGSNFAAKGMDLSFIAPTLKNGEVIVELCKEETEEDCQKWRQALILYVVTGDPTIGAMERYIAST